MRVAAFRPYKRAVDKANEGDVEKKEKDRRNCPHCGVRVITTTPLVQLTLECDYIYIEPERGNR